MLGAGNNGREAPAIPRVVLNKVTAFEATLSTEAQRAVKIAALPPEVKEEARVLILV